MMRWWPPLLHLLVMAALLPIVWHRVAVLPEGAVTAPVMEGATAPVAAEDLASLLSAGGVVAPGALLARPLFTPGRLGEAAAPAALPENEQATPVAVPRMVGYVDDGTKARALLASDTGGEEAIVREGDEFLGFTVLQVKPDAVVLRGDGEEITVKMFPQ
jgi:hypothetical protein